MTEQARLAELFRIARVGKVNLFHLPLIEVLARLSEDPADGARIF